MSLTILIRGHMSSIPTLADVCFTKANFGVGLANSTLSVNTPRGVLSGSVASVVPAGSGGGDYTVLPGDATHEPIGLFVNDAAGAAFDNAPAVASGKIAIIKGIASVEVDVYETTSTAGGNPPITYNVGDKLFSSAQGFLTNENAGGQTVIGVCTKAPTVASPTLGLDMRI